MASDSQDVLSHIEAEKEGYLEELKDFIRIPSISTDPDFKGEVLRASEFLTRTEVDVHARRIFTALADLRAVLTEAADVRRLRAQGPDRTLARLRREHADLPLEIRATQWPSARHAHLGELLDHFLEESVANAVKHAHPTRLEVAIDADETALRVEVSNDGVARASGGGGMGLRLLCEHALQHGAVVSYGVPAPGRWHMRLVAPVEGGANE